MKLCSWNQKKTTRLSLMILLIKQKAHMMIKRFLQTLPKFRSKRHKSNKKKMTRHKSKRKKLHPLLKFQRKMLNKFQLQKRFKKPKMTKLTRQKQVSKETIK